MSKFFNTVELKDYRKNFIMAFIEAVEPQYQKEIRISDIKVFIRECISWVEEITDGDLSSGKLDGREALSYYL